MQSLGCVGFYSWNRLTIATVLAAEGAKVVVNAKLVFSTAVNASFPEPPLSRILLRN